MTTKKIVLSQTKLTKSRVDIRKNDFDRLLIQDGYLLLWEKSIRCPCYRDDSGQPKMDCTVCKGRGFQYYDPEEIIAGITQIEPVYNRGEQGEWNFGNANMTIRAENDVQQFDRITFLDSQAELQEIIKRDTTKTIESVRYPIVSVTKLKTLNTEFIEDTDFQITDGKIEWLAGGVSPADEENYSVKYKFHPPYIVIEFPHEIRGTLSKLKAPQIAYNDLPRQCIIRREWII